MRAADVVPAAAASVGRRVPVQPGRQAVVRRPAQQLQPAHPAGQQQHRHRPGQAGSQAVAAHRVESQGSDLNDERMAGARMGRPQIHLGTTGIRRRQRAVRAVRAHLAAGYRPLQQR